MDCQIRLVFLSFSSMDEPNASKDHLPCRSHTKVSPVVLYFTTSKLSNLGFKFSSVDHSSMQICPKNSQGSFALWKTPFSRRCFQILALTLKLSIRSSVMDHCKCTFRNRIHLVQQAYLHHERPITKSFMVLYFSTDSTWIVKTSFLSWKARKDERKCYSIKFAQIWKLPKMCKGAGWVQRWHFQLQCHVLSIMTPGT